MQLTYNVFICILVCVLVGCSSSSNGGENGGPDGSPDLDVDSDTDGDADGDGDSDGDTDADADTDVHLDTDCGSADVSFDKQIPTVLLLVDQSGSMTQNFGGKSRWDALGDTLFSDTQGLVKQLESDVRFGLALYTSDDGVANPPCPRIQEVAPAIDNFDEIFGVFDAAAPDEDTPTGASVLYAGQSLSKVTAPGDKVIVLATDGEPDSCTIPDPNNNAQRNETRAEAVDAVTSVFQNGIRTYIISVGDDIAEAHLQDVANAGQGVKSGDPDAKFYSALNQLELAEAFQEIITGVRSCKLTLDQAIVSGKESECEVAIDGQAATYNDPNGWRVNTPTEVEFLGSSCDAVQGDAQNLTVSCPCGAVRPVK